jgi:hypothetical protein
MDRIEKLTTRFEQRISVASDAELELAAGIHEHDVLGNGSVVHKTPVRQAEILKAHTHVVEISLQIRVPEAVGGPKVPGCLLSRPGGGVIGEILSPDRTNQGLLSAGAGKQQEIEKQQERE